MVRNDLTYAQQCLKRLSRQQLSWSQNICFNQIKQQLKAEKLHRDLMDGKKLRKKVFII